MRRALAAIYRQHRQGLFTLALAITGDPESAEDAVHEAFVRLWRSKSRPASDAVGYVFAAVRNAAVDQVRRRRPALPATASIFDDSAASPDVAAAQGEQCRILRRALEALPADQREAIVLRVYAGLTFRQMAEALGQPLPTVASRYRRGLESIRETLREVL